MTALRSASFHVPGEPVGKGRPKFTSRGGYARAYTPAKTVAYESRVASAATRSMMGLAPMPGVIAATLSIVMAIPKSTTKARRAAMIAGVEYPTKVPDVDNVAKTVLDSCNGITFVDDKQVCVLNARKRYGESPGVHVEFAEIAE